LTTTALTTTTRKCTTTAFVVVPLPLLLSPSSVSIPITTTTTTTTSSSRIILQALSKTDDKDDDTIIVTAKVHTQKYDDSVDSDEEDDEDAITKTIDKLNKKETIANNPRLTGLAFELDNGTRKSHSMAQNSAFVEGFFKGISTPQSYIQLVTSLYYVYQAMERDVLDTITNSNDAATYNNMIKKIDDKSLRRMNGLEQDMEYLYGVDWKTTMSKPTRATEKYVARIREIAATAAADNYDDSSSSKQYLFIAHQYTRYLGDLFGGQMMGGMASRSMDLPSDGSGIQFYTFDSIPKTKTKQFIDEWYIKLNTIGMDLTTQQRQDIVDEANLVFDLNIGILQELEGSPWQAVWTMTISSIKEKLGF